MLNEALTIFLNEIEQPDKIVAVTGISTDSREIKPGELYIPLRGERFDGHQYIDECYEKGASLIFRSDKNDQKSVFVEDTLKAYQKLAMIHLNEWRKKSPSNIVISLTGSNGKTTTKEFLTQLASLLEIKNFSTQKNFNNQVGVPKTIFEEIKVDSSLGIIETGTNAPGEILPLAKIIHPDFSLITNIGDSHLEKLISREGVFNEKSALLDITCEVGGEILLNMDDPLLEKYQHPKMKPKFLSSKKRESHFHLDYNTRALIQAAASLSIIFPQTKNWGEHQVFDLALAVSIMLMAFPEKSEHISEVAAKVELPRGMNRAEWILGEKRRLYLDAYNANPQSVVAALKHFKEALKENENYLIVLGDMNELGERTPGFHEEVGKFLRENEFKSCLFLGRFAKHYAAGFKFDCHVEERPENFSKALESALPVEGAILIKGSRSLQLEDLVDIVI